MIRLGLLRRFHILIPTRGNFKNKLNVATKYGTVKKTLSKTQLKKMQKQDDAKLMTKNKKQLAPAAALKLAKSTLNSDSLDRVDPTVKLSLQDLQSLYQNPNRRLLYNFLGTSGDQLNDSYVVEKDVLKLLERDDLPRALYLVRLAKDNGIVGMNRIMQYLLKRDKISLTFQLIALRKKWGVATNSLTYTIIFQGCAKAESNLNLAQSRQLVALLQKAHKDKLANVIHLNALLDALSKSEKLPLVWEVKELFIDTLPKIEPDAITYTLLFKALGKSENNKEALETANSLWEEIVHNRKVKIDSYLARAYALLYLRSKNIELIKRGIIILRSYYDVCPVDEVENISMKPPKKATTVPVLLPVDTINPRKLRFQPDKAVEEILQHSYMRLTK
ncbi:hypothetical protein LJB42_001924 [Komagataella kurtzmanii]|nr:hypothetical protein LJB42_001924 [Komagataella kurtzmanii]